MSISRVQVLKLYKDLLKYSKTLKLTDVYYYKRRIANEFKLNKTLSKPEDINYAYKVFCLSIEVAQDRVLWRFREEIYVYVYLRFGCSSVEEGLKYVPDNYWDR